MNIKEFLIDNYIYIIIVIILIIITIIGFLADKKRSNDKGKDNANNNNNNTNQAMMGQNLVNNQSQVSQVSVVGNNGMAVQPNVAPVVQSVNPPVQNNANVSMNQAVVNQNVVPTPVDVVSPDNQNVVTNPEPMYTSLSDQKPVIAPVDPAQNINNYRQNVSGISPQVNAQNIPQSVNQNIGLNQGMTSSMAVSSQNPTQMPINPNANVVPTPMPANINSQPVPTPMNNQNYNSMAQGQTIQQQQVNQGVGMNYVNGAQAPNQNSNNQFM